MRSQRAPTIFLAPPRLNCNSPVASTRARVARFASGAGLSSSDASEPVDAVSQPSSSSAPFAQDSSSGASNLASPSSMPSHVAEKS